ncbi:MAG: hypothetical protein KME31_22895 [Tolypothrix carrinoi HA7290-LM1]|nr:hypothetical protein [Tolypothrix carrinoi HA7290-LM1]
MFYSNTILSMPHAPCPMPHAPCPMPHAPCPMPHARCPMPDAPCPMPHARCPMPDARCPMPFINKIVINSTIALNRNYYINPLGVFNEVLLIDAFVFG